MLEKGGTNLQTEDTDMERMVQDHEKRILALEQNYSEVKKEMTAVQTSQLEIKGVLLKEGQDNRQLLNDQQKEQRELFQQLMKHTLGIKANNNNKKWELALAIVGGGGFLFLLIQYIGELLTK
jgi:uncharacterized protein YeeX (DUF496 family)